MSQLDLLPTARPKGGDVSEEIVARLPNLLAAIKLSMDVSGLNDQQIADAIDVDSAQLSRIKRGDMHFPPNKLVNLMDVCGNEIPLRWLAWTRNWELKRRMSAIEAENLTLRALLVEREHDLDVLKRFVRETGR